MNNMRSLLFILLLAKCSLVVGYELGTHARLTKQAFLQASLISNAFSKETFGFGVDDPCSSVGWLVRGAVRIDNPINRGDAEDRS